MQRLRTLLAVVSHKPESMAADAGHGLARSCCRHMERESLL